MIRNKMTKILSAPDKEVGKTYGQNGILSRLFRQMLADLNVTNYKWEAYMADFIRDVGGAGPTDRKSQTTTRGNLTKEFQKEQMTWKVFCKVLRFLQIMRFRITITAFHADGQTTEHSTEVNFGPRTNAAAVVAHLDQPEPEDDDDTLEGEFYDEQWLDDEERRQFELFEAIAAGHHKQKPAPAPAQAELALDHHGQ